MYGTLGTLFVTNYFPLLTDIDTLQMRLCMVDHDDEEKVEVYSQMADALEYVELIKLPSDW